MSIHVSDFSLLTLKPFSILMSRFGKTSETRSKSKTLEQIQVIFSKITLTLKKFQYSLRYLPTVVNT